MIDSAKVLSSGVVIQLDDTSVLTWLTNNQEFCRAISGLHWNSKYPTFWGCLYFGPDCYNSLILCSCKCPHDGVMATHLFEIQ